MALIRIPVPGAGYVIEFDSDKIVSVESPREVADVPGVPGRKELPGPNSLVLHFATLDDAPKWADGMRAAGMTPAGQSQAISAAQAVSDVIKQGAVRYMLDWLDADDLGTLRELLG